MRLIAWHELDDDERKVASAQMIVLLVCVSPLLGLLAAIVGMLFGSRTLPDAFAANPKGVLLGVIWVALYALAGFLIGARRMVGGILGLALFAWSIMESAKQGRLLSFNAAFAALGIIVIARAGGVLGFPFWPGKPVAPTTTSPSVDGNIGRTDHVDRTDTPV